MAGVFGIFAKTKSFSQEELTHSVLCMADSMKSRAWLRTEIRQTGQLFCGGRSHLGVLNPQERPLTADQNTKKFWVDGELYSESTEFGIDPDYAQLEQLLGSANESVLAKTDGVFTLVAYDLQKHELVLANDRLGFRPLYYLETADYFAYAAEVKALLAICDQLPPLDEQALRQFFGYGYLLGERTWWQNIKLLPPASIWRVTVDGVDKRCYWTFDDIAPNPMPEAEVEREFKRRWSQAVSQRSKKGMMPLLLSGGLDSRLLLAELRAQGREVTTITFGSEASTDMQIAQQCADIAGVKHFPLVLDADNWWHRREDAIWQTDGLANCMDLHVALATDHLHMGNSYSPMNLAGDVIFGGSYLRESFIETWRKQPVILLDTKYHSNPFFSLPEVLSASDGDYQSYLVGPSSDCYYILQRQRRMTLTGPGAYASHCETVYPSLSLPLLELVFGSLTDSQRIHSQFYNKFLIHNYPAYYSAIPWQRTGRGFAEPLTVRARRKITRKARQFLRKPEPVYDTGFANYPHLLQASGIREKLLGEKLLSDEILNGAVHETLKDEQLPFTNPYSLTAILTFELYLRQVTNMPSLVKAMTN